MSIVTAAATFNALNGVNNFHSVFTRRHWLSLKSRLRWPSLDFLADSCTHPPFTDQGQIWHTGADRWSAFTCHMLAKSVYSVASGRRKTANFALFSTLTSCNGATWQRETWLWVHCYKPSPNQWYQNVSIVQRLLGKVAFMNNREKTDVFGSPSGAWSQRLRLRLSKV